MTLSSARFVPDRLGGVAELVRGGDRDTETTSDGAVDVAGADTYIAMPRVIESRLESTVDLDMSTADVTTVTFLRSYAHDSPNTEYVSVYSPSGQRFYPHFAGGSSGTTSLILSRESDNTAIAASVFLAGMREKLAIRWSVDWDHNGPNIPRLTVEYSDSVANPMWVVAGTADWAEAMKRPSGLSTVWVGHATAVPLGGGLISYAVANDDVVVFSANPGRDRIGTDSPGSWTDADSAALVSIKNVVGEGLKARIVEGRNQANLDGSNDYWELAGNTPLTVQGDGTIECGGILVVESLTVLDSWARLLSTTSENANGFDIVVYKSSHVNAGKMYAGLSGPNSAPTTGPTDETYEDGRFAVAWRIGDVDGQRLVSIRTDREDWKHSSPLGDLGLITHLSMRVGSVAYGVSGGDPLAFSRLVLWDGNSASEQAPSLDDMTLAMTAALDGAGKA